MFKQEHGTRNLWENKEEANSLMNSELGILGTCKKWTEDYSAPKAELRNLVPLILLSLKTTGKQGSIERDLETRNTSDFEVNYGINHC